MKLEHPKLEPWVNDLVRRSDFQTVFGLLEMARKHAQNSHGFASFQSLIPNQDRYSRWTELARSIHGDLVDRAESVFKESDRKDNLIKRRAIVKKKEHRFLLALLLNVPDRTRLLEIVKSEYPEAESVELVADWVEELSHIRKDGSDEPNVLGIEDLGALSLAVLESLLRGKSLSDTTKFCCEEFGAEDSGEFRASVEAVYNGHLSSPIFSAQFG